MLVYGDRIVSETPTAVVDCIRADLAAAGSERLWILRHERLVRALIESGRLAQGLADAAFEARGYDGPDPAADAALALTRRIAGEVIASLSSPRPGRSGEPGSPWVPDRAFRLSGMRGEVRLKTPEGYAFYAVYPETYALAAEQHERGGTVLGLRSIGTSLGAMVAARSKAKTFVSVRPCGHPFAREIKLRRDLEMRGAVAIVDEGPGLSGSSFGAAGDLFGDAAVSFFPSHLGDLGPRACERHRRRWASARRLHVPFEAFALAGRRPLASWFADLVGPTAALEDLSGGAWRRGEDAPVHPQQERRKYRLRTDQGAFLLKFTGLSREAAARLERGRALHAAGFTAEPLALRHGFLLERWLEGARPLRPSDRPRLIETLGRYLAFRGCRLPADTAGATPAELIEMAAYNSGQLLDAAAGERARSRLAPLSSSTLRPIRTDARLHAWEWRVLPDGRILKTDALDHDDAHDLIGCQDIAWDLAGAAVELDLSDAEAQALCARCGTGPALYAAMRIAYLAFQGGAWTLAGQAAAADERPRIERLVAGYRTKLARVLAEHA